MIKMEIHPLEHLRRMVARHPWAILPEKLDEILALLDLHEAGIRFTPEEIQARIGDGPRRTSQVVGRIAIVPVYGTIVPRAGLMTEVSGAISAEQLARDMRRLAADEGVDAIVMDVDSPGGNVIGVPELAAQIRASRELKPVIAIANPLAASAAYWISAQASSLSVTPSGSVGSIGVFAVHEDLSRAVEGQGRKVSLISAGKYKLEGNPFEPLSEEARAAIQERIDSAYGWFVGDVAKGRGVSEAAVRSGFGEGRMVFADQALDERMVDRTETLDEVVARVQSNPTSKSKAFAAAAGVASAQPGGVAGQEPANVAALLNLVEAEN